MMVCDPLKLLEERPEETARRLRALAREELEEMTASGAAVATAMDGSLSSGRFWPSSDLDLTIVPPNPEEHGLGGGQRGGIGIHQHILGWGVLDWLRKDWPKSSAVPPEMKWYWMQDTIWLLDGLGTMTPVHDPGGRLAELQAFVRERRFSPDVTVPRWPAIAKGALAAANDGYLTSGGELLAGIWFEATRRIISSKESDPELRAACAEAGAPQAHSLFRRVGGVEGIEGREAEFERACREMLEVFSPWMDTLLERTQFKHDKINAPIPSVLYIRQMVWSGLYAPHKGCLLHLAAIRRALTEEEASPAVLAGLAAGQGGYLVDRLPAIESARRNLLALFPDDQASRRSAFDEVLDLTRRTFSIRTGV